jgi:hypothetical protein
VQGWKALHWYCHNVLSDEENAMNRYRVCLYRSMVLFWVLDMVACPGVWGAPPSSLLTQAPTFPNTTVVAPAREQPGSLSGILLQNNRLSVDVRDQDLHAVIQAIASQGDIDIRWLEEVPNKRISMRFSHLPLVTGLQRLFRAAEIGNYVLVTEPHTDGIRVQRMLFLTTSEGGEGTRLRPRVARRPPPPPPPQIGDQSLQSQESDPPPQSQESDQPPQPQGEEQTEGDTEQREAASVFDELKTNTAARRLLSQLVHPNEQVRERALERLVRLVGEDEKQAELMEFLEPLLEGLASEDQIEREESRQEIRKLLRR